MVSPNLLKQTNNKGSRHFTLDPSTHTHSEEKPTKLYGQSKASKSVYFCSINGLKWFPQHICKRTSNKGSRHFTLDPSIHTHSEEKPTKLYGQSKASKSLYFCSIKGLKWFPPTYLQTNQQQRLKAFHLRPFHPHPFRGKTHQTIWTIKGFQKPLFL